MVPPYTIDVKNSCSSYVDNLIWTPKAYGKMCHNILQCRYMDCRNYGYFTFTFARVWLVHYVANVTGTPVALDGVATQLLTWGRIAQALILHWLREEITFWLLPRGFNNQ